MSKRNEAGDLIWLEEAFAKGVIDELSASCCLAGLPEADVKIKPVPLNRLHWSDIETPIVSKIFEMVTTWPNLTRLKPLLWYIEQAVTKTTPHVNFDLLLPKCVENEYRKKECIDNYPKLAMKLGLIDTSAAFKKKKTQLADDDWIINARKIDEELHAEKKGLSKEKKAKAVETEMKNRHKKKQKGMTKRGGKEVPSWQSILRHAL